jgi:O-glycosyl hydrolase
MRNMIFAAFTALFVLAFAASAQNTTVDGVKKYQTIHGFGVNINPQSWNVNPEAVKAVIDSLITGMGCTSFRIMFDDSDWEVTNDNDDPGLYNWTYYDGVYSAPRFVSIWSTIEYLNSKGITDITLSPDGAAPVWMGGTKLLPGAEKEYAEMLASMVFYGIKRRTPAINFTMLSPVNETGCFGLEAPVMTTNQLGAIFSNIASHLINDGLVGVTLTGPDDCYNSFNVHVLINSSVTMSKLTSFGGHEYGNNTSRSEELIYAVRNSDYTDREVIMSEVNAICNGCDGGEYNSDYGFDNYAGPAYKYVLKHLNAGVAGIQLWEGYDSRYHHPNRYLTWSMWGIFAVNDTLRPDVYTKRAHYYTFKQLFSFVKPGFERIDIATSLPNLTVSAFRDPANGTIVITGKNDSANPQTIEGILKNITKSSTLKFYHTDATHNFFRDSDVIVTNQSFSTRVPASCVFTITSM